MIIGVDNGNVNTKTMSEVFTSGLTKHDLKPPLNKEILEWNGKYYTLSNDRLLYMRDKTANDSTYILTLFAMAKQILAEGAYNEFIDVDLAVGLPPEHYSMLKDNFAQYFYKYGNEIKFKFKDKPFNLNLNSVNVYPQGFAAIANKTDELSKFSRCYVIDIGGYTTDVLLLNNGTPDLSYLRSLETGIITMNNNIKGRVNAFTGAKIEDSHIYDVLLNREHILNNQIEKIIKEGAKEHAELILHDLREHGIDLFTTPSIFVGGGTLLLSDYIESSPNISQPQFVKNISANALGYTLLNSIVLKRNS